MAEMHLAELYGRLCRPPRGRAHARQDRPEAGHTGVNIGGLGGVFLIGSARPNLA